MEGAGEQREREGRTGGRREGHGSKGRGEQGVPFKSTVFYIRNVKKIGICTLTEENFLKTPDGNGYIPHSNPVRSNPNLILATV